MEAVTGEVVATTTAVVEGAGGAMTGMASGTRCAGHIAEMTVVVAVVRTAADAAAIAAGIGSQRTIGGRSQRGIVTAEEGVEAEATEIAVAAAEAMIAMGVVEEEAVVEGAAVGPRTGRSRVRGTRGWRWSSSGGVMRRRAGSTTIR